MYGIARGVGFILSGGQPVSIQVRGLGQVGNGYLLYYYPQSGFTLFNPPPGLAGAQLRQVVGILPHTVTCHRAAHRGMLVPAVAYALRPAHVRRRRQ